MKIPVGMAEVIEEYYKYEDILTLIIYIFLVSYRQHIAGSSNT